jgi:rhodanese-like protein
MRKTLVLLAGLALVLSACSSTAETPQPSPAIGEPQIPESEVPRVPLEDAKAAFDSGTAVFVDVRGAGSYEESHVPGALSIPLPEIETRLGELDPQQWIITYCT